MSRTREWSTAANKTICGGCGDNIERGDSIQVVTIPGVTRKRLRCARCADSNQPPIVPQLPANIETHDIRRGPAPTALRNIPIPEADPDEREPWGER